jgi:uncharacterized damage-inducible protein DinB
MSREISEPAPNIPDFYRRYIQLFPDRQSALETLASFKLETWLKQYSNMDFTRPYATGKWNVLQVIRHLVDAERVFQFRALWIARGTSEPQPGYDQDAWAIHYRHLTDASHLQKLLAEYRIVRQSSLLLAQTFTAEDWARKGTANGTTMTPAFLFQSMAGHEIHHIEILAAHLSVLLNP